MLVCCISVSRVAGNGAFSVLSDRQHCGIGGWGVGGVGALAAAGKLKACGYIYSVENSSKDVMISTRHMCFPLTEHVTQINYTSVAPPPRLGGFRFACRSSSFHHREMWLDSHSSGIFCVRPKLDLVWIHHTTYFLLGNAVRSRRGKHTAEKRSPAVKAGTHMLAAGSGS